MRKLLFLTVVGLIAGTLQAGQVPPTITYQGTLRQSGVPFDGDVTMQFRITGSPDPAARPIWTSSLMTIHVKQGLFTALLTPDTVDWQNSTPYIQVVVGTPGQALGPSEPINSTAYSFMAGSVIDNAISTSKIANGAVTPNKLDATIQNFILPSGTIMAYGGVVTPQLMAAGWLPCDGSAVSRTTYSNLLAALGNGTLWGNGDGINTFNVPDLRGRAPIGFGPAPGITDRNLGVKGGSETHTLSSDEMPAHTHDIHDPGHTHSFTKGADAITTDHQTDAAKGGGAQIGDGGPILPSFTNISILSAGGRPDGSTAPHTIMQPYAVVNYIIKT